METNDAPKSNRGRKPSKWQYVWQSRDSETHEGTAIAIHGVDDGENIVWFGTAKKAKAALAYARAFGFIPDEVRVRNY